jgi:hypothetical protein
MSENWHLSMLRWTSAESSGAMCPPPPLKKRSRNANSRTNSCFRALPSIVFASFRAVPTFASAYHIVIQSLLKCCRALVLPCSRAAVLSCCRALVLPCSRAAVLSCLCRIVIRTNPLARRPHQSLASLQLIPLESPFFRNRLIALTLIRLAYPLRRSSGAGNINSPSTKPLSGSRYVCPG